MRDWIRWTALSAVLACSAGMGGGLPRASAAPAPGPSAGRAPRVYWDQNEEEDWLVHPGLQQPEPLVPAWDANGQMCLFPDGSGLFTTAYNPTTSSQTGNGGLGKPVKLPPVGEEVWDRTGRFSGQTIAVPGPYLGGDIPGNTQDPRDGSFNNNGTYVGCAFDPRTGNLFATDIGNSQGQLPPSDSGRLVEWFARGDYAGYCIVDGPTAGGSEPHHVDGTGGLRQPGTIALDGSGNVLVPVIGDAGTTRGEVLEYAAATLPTDPSQCPSAHENMPLTPATRTVFIDTSANDQPTPQGIGRDPVCRCWAVSSVLVGHAVAWYTVAGAPDPGRPPVPGDPPPPASPGGRPSGYTPQGIAFTPDGTLYFADLHVTCVSPPSETDPTSAFGCGPASRQGQVMRVTFSQPGSLPSVPAPVNTAPLDFPVSVTACDPAVYAHCPAPVA